MSLHNSSPIESVLVSHRELWEGIYEPSEFLPTKMIIETMGNYNRTCPYCPVSTNPKRRGRLNTDVVFNLLTQLRELVYNGIVRFHFYNELLIDKRIVNFLARPGLYA